MWKLHKANGEIERFTRREFYLHLKTKGQIIDFTKTNKQYQKHHSISYHRGSYLIYTKYHTLYAVV